jgi:heme iron utilization protein
MSAEMEEKTVTWLRSAHFGSLSTLQGGSPFGSLVAYALNDAGQPLLFLSDLAVHEKALRQDARCSLLVTDPNATDPPSSWRVTLVGRASIDDAATPLFLARHPQTQLLGGFHTWRIDVERTRYIAGFGSMGWL